MLRRRKRNFLEKNQWKFEIFLVKIGWKSFVKFSLLTFVMCWYKILGSLSQHRFYFDCVGARTRTYGCWMESGSIIFVVHNKIYFPFTYFSIDFGVFGDTLPPRSSFFASLQFPKFRSGCNFLCERAEDVLLSGFNRAAAFLCFLRGGGS